MKMKLILTLLFLIAAQPIFAQDVVPLDSTNEAAIRTFNDEIRKTLRRVYSLENGLSLSGSTITGILPISKGGTGVALADPGADRILFWDDSAGETSFLSVGGGLTISGTTLSGSSSELFVSTGTFTAPAGVTRVFLTMVGAGGGGATGTTDTSGGGGGGGGAMVINYPFTVVPGNNYTVTINSGGATSTDGGTTSFDTLIVKGGKGAPAGGSVGGLSGNAVALNVSSIGIGNNGGTGEAGTGARYGGAGAGTIFGAGGDGGASGANNGANAANGTGAGGGGGGSSGVSAGTGGSGGSGFVIVNY